jgi:hypothetical protein
MKKKEEATIKVRTNREKKEKENKIKDVCI